LPSAKVVSSDGKALLRFPRRNLYRPIWTRALAIFGILALFPLVPLANQAKSRYMRKDAVKTGVSNTAIMVAKGRFIAHCLGLIDDPCAWYLLPWRERIPAVVEYFQYALFGRTIIPFGDRFLPMLVSRTLFYDSVVENSGLKQYVILGAGFDCRGHRLNLPKGCRVFEVDAPLTQKSKKELVEYNVSKFPRHSQITYVSCDFSTDDFLERLQANGFDINIPTVFTLEGVARYLTWEQLSATMKKITKCAKGSLLALGISIDFWSKPEKREKYKSFQVNLERVAKLGEPVKFGMDEDKDTPASKFLPLGFSEVEIWLGPEEIKRRYFTDNSFLNPGSNFNSHLVVLKV